MTHPEDDKKKKIRERNKRQQMIFHHAELMREGVDIAAPVSESKAVGKFTKKEEKSAAAKMPGIFNNLKRRKVESEERWNRYAATSDAGSHGR